MTTQSVLYEVNEKVGIVSLNRRSGSLFNADPGSRFTAD